MNFVYFVLVIDISDQAGARLVVQFPFILLVGVPTDAPLILIG